MKPNKTVGIPLVPIVWETDSEPEDPGSDEDEDYGKIMFCF